MVNHWLNWNDDNNNVVVSNHVSLCVGSCGKDQLFSVDQKLGSGVPIATALENAKLTLITFKSLINVRYVRHSSAVLITYRKKETEQSIEIELGSQEKAEEIFDHISQYVCASMVKRLRDSSPYYSLVLIVCSFLFAGVFLYSYFNKFRLLAYLLPVLCLIGTFAYVFRMEKIQGRIIRWTRESEGLRLYKPALIATGACLIFSTFSLSTAPYFDDRYGQSALYSAAKSGVLEADDTPGYINRGAYVNYALDETDSVLR